MNTVIQENSQYCPSCGAKVNSHKLAEEDSIDEAKMGKMVMQVNVGKDTAKLDKPHVDNHLGLAIFVTVFCCQLTGIIAIIYALQVNSRMAAGDVKGAATSADVAMWWIVGTIVIVSFLGFCFLVGALL